MKKLLKLAFVAVLATGMVACGDSNENAEQVEAHDHSEHEGHDHEGHDHGDHAEGISGEFTIDTENSQVAWKGGVISIGGEPLKSHNGTISITQGKVSMKNGELAAGKIEIDMNTIVTLDDNYNVDEGSTPEKLIGHLTSEDFFYTEKFPTASFNFSATEGQPITGTMTIRGISNEEQLTDLSIDSENGVITVSGDLKIDRQKYDVAYDMGAKDALIADGINFEFVIVANEINDETASTEELEEAETEM